MLTKLSLTSQLLTLALTCVIIAADHNCKRQQSSEVTISIRPQAVTAYIHELLINSVIKYYCA